MDIHIFATIMALYPFTPTEEIAAEFGINTHKVEIMAWANGVHKTHEFRSEVCRKNGKTRKIEKL